MCTYRLFSPHAWRRALALVALISWAPYSLGQDLRVSAAISLQPLLQAIAPRFEKQHPDAHIIFNFAASGILLRQIANGAPVDVLITADEETMTLAQNQNLILASSRANLASNRLALVAPSSGEPTLKGLRDLSAGWVGRIAIGNPHTVPAGRYAQHALERAGLWEPLRRKTVWCESSRQVLTYVVRGEVDAGFVYASDVDPSDTRLHLIGLLDSPIPIRYPMARATQARQPRLADAFLLVLRDPQTQAELARYGFGAP